MKSISTFTLQSVFLFGIHTSIASASDRCPAKSECCSYSPATNHITPYSYYLYKEVEKTNSEYLRLSKITFDWDNVPIIQKVTLDFESIESSSTEQISVDILVESGGSIT